MTRFLSESLQAHEPFFRLGLQRLERANDNPNTDIRFSTEIMSGVRAKLKELGLDAHDTTAEELYHVLQARLKDDDKRLTRTLQARAASYVSAEAKVTDGLVHALKEFTTDKQCFAIKAAPLRAMLKKLPPKRAQKQLGYRSLDSFLKHESPASALAAGWLSESVQWQQKFVDQYKKLKPNDFESRAVAIVQPKGLKWQKLAATAVAKHKHTVLSFSELGTIVLLPLSADMPEGSVTASLALALHNLNQIYANSSFLRLSQVRKDFGAMAYLIAKGEAQLDSQVLDKAVPWHLVQRFYSRMEHLFREELFEPHVQLEDLKWHPVEHILTKIEPSFGFWQDSAHLGMLHDHKAVSLNLLDAALNYCNNLPFEQRLQHYFQGAVWHELLLRYLQPDTVEQTILAHLQPQLKLQPEPALA